MCFLYQKTVEYRLDFGIDIFIGSITIYNQCLGVRELQGLYLVELFKHILSINKHLALTRAIDLKYLVSLAVAEEKLLGPIYLYQLSEDSNYWNSESNKSKCC